MNQEDNKPINKPLVILTLPQARSQNMDFTRNKEFLEDTNRFVFERYPTPDELIKVIETTLTNKESKIRLKQRVKSAKKDYDKKIKRNPGKEKLEDIQKDLVRKMVFIYRDYLSDDCY